MPADTALTSARLWCHNGTMPTARPNQSVLAAMECLQALADAARPVGSRELARAVGMEHTKVSRALGTLALTGLAQRTPHGQYCPGPAVHVLAARSLHGGGLLPAALPHLRKLKWEGLAVALGVLWDGQVCYLVHSQQHQGLEEGVGRHAVHPPFRSSLGLALLAEAGPPAPDAVGAREAEALEDTRRRGYALLRLPHGEVSVAAALGRPATAAIGASAPRLTEEKAAALGARLLNSANSIASALAGGP
jgi:DNA-binding IclR family transcriptional regulator